MASVSVVFRKDKLNKKNEAPIHYRIIKDRKISYISTGIMLSIDDWDAKRNCVKARHANSVRLNAYITTKFTEVQDQVLEIETSSKSKTSRGIRNEVYGKKTTDFFAFADVVLAKYKAAGQIGTYKKNTSTITKLKEYHKNKSLDFQDITVDFLKKYEKYLRDDLNNQTNTIHKDLKFLRKLFNDAYAEELIEHNIIPFNKYKLKTAKTERSYLSEEELKLVEDFSIPEDLKKKIHRDMFIFAAYTGGLRISDMLQLRWVNFDGVHISFKIKKTGSQQSIKVPNKGLDILKRYMPEKADKKAFIFPVLPENTKMDDPEELDTAINRASVLVNKSLKSIKDDLELEKPLTFHISRHSFATRALRKGISIDKVSKIMGHAQIRETQIYAKIVSSELDKAMDVFNEVEEPKN